MQRYKNTERKVAAHVSKRKTTILIINQGKPWPLFSSCFQSLKRQLHGVAGNRRAHSIANGVDKVQKVAKLNLGFWVTFGVCFICGTCALSGHVLFLSQKLCITNRFFSLKVVCYSLSVLPSSTVRYWSRCCWLRFWFTCRWCGHPQIKLSGYYCTTSPFYYTLSRNVHHIVSFSWTLQGLACPQDKADSARKHCLAHAFESGQQFLIWSKTFSNLSITSGLFQTLGKFWQKDVEMRS